MSQFLLLHDKNICPACRVRRSFIDGNCHNCGLRLFTSGNNNFEKFETETGVMHWWGYDSRDGWKHRDHWMIPKIQPNIRYYTPPKLAKDYGQKLPERGGKKVRIRR